MATIIRFSRYGTKKKPFFRIVVQDHHFPRDGRFIEKIGHYNPVVGFPSLSVARDRLEYWLSTGAQLSDSVRTALKVKLREWNTASGQIPGGSVAAAPAPISSKDKPAAKKNKKTKEASAT